MGIGSGHDWMAEMIAVRDVSKGSRCERVISVMADLLRNRLLHMPTD